MEIDGSQADAEMLSSINRYFGDDGPRETPLPPATPEPTPTPTPGATSEPTPTTPITPAATEGSEGEPTLQDQLADLAKTYGVPASELAGFTSAEEAEADLRGYLNDIASQGRMYGQQPQPHPGQQPPNGADAQFQQPPLQQPPTQFTPQQTLPAPPQIDLSQLEEGHPLRAALQAQSDYLNSLHQQIQQFDSAQQQAVAMHQQREAQLFREQCADMLSSISSDRYGSAEKQNMFQQQKETKVIEHAAAIAAGLSIRQMPMPSTRELLVMADRALFFQEIEKERLRNREAARSSQNGARLGRPNAATRVVDDYDPSIPFEDQPVFHQMYYEMEQQGV